MFFRISGSGIILIKIFRGLFFLILIFLPYRDLPAREDRDRFFFHHRLYLRPEFVERISELDSAHKDLADFTLSYMEGLRSYETGRFADARSSFLAARKAWPEYFYTDLMLGMTLENMGEYRRAARFFKSYLNKLERYHKGYYRLSSPVIFGISSGRIEDQGTAYREVESRLEGYGIDIRKVRPVYSPPFFLFPAIVILFSAGTYVLVFMVLLPYFRKKERERNPPEGFWTCKNCGAYNPELGRECVKCGKARN